MRILSQNTGYMISTARLLIKKEFTATAVGKYLAWSMVVSNVVV
jgi:hypothetical protein